MSRVILGDNPFFGVSHYSPEKSSNYIADANRFSNASDVIKSAGKLGIELLMISSHEETAELLATAGYGTPKSDFLPDICLLVPNVHDMNKSAAAGGVYASLRALFKGTKLSDFIRPRRLLSSVLLGNNNFPEVTHVGLHNIATDLMIGLNARWVLRIFCAVTRFCGFKPVLVTLNPDRLREMKVLPDAICCYYNLTGYNVCHATKGFLEEETSRDARRTELWAMGVLASGVVEYQDLEKDETLRRFDRVVVASSRPQRVKEMFQIITSSSF